MVEFRSPRTWRNNGIKPTDLNREVRDQIRKLQKEILILQASSGAGVVSPGTIVASVGTTVPTGWLLCDGRSTISKTTYPDLWNTIGVAYGTATTNTFTLPDFRNKFPRGNAALGDGTITGRGNASGADSETISETLTIGNTSVSLPTAGAHVHQASLSHTHSGGANHAWFANTTNHAHGTNAHGHSIGGSTANGNRGNGTASTCAVSHGHGTNSGSVGNTNAAGDSFNLNYTGETFTGISSNVNVNATSESGGHAHNSTHSHSYNHSHNFSTVPRYEGVSYMIKT